MDCPSNALNGGGNWSGWAADRYHDSGGDQGPPQTGAPWSNCQALPCYPLTEVVGYWHIPAAGDNGNHYTTASAWVGIGGMHNAGVSCNASYHGLVQAGTESIHDASASVGRFFAFIENLDANTDAYGCAELGVDDFDVAPGDQMHVYIGASSSTSSKQSRACAIKSALAPRSVSAVSQWCSCSASQSPAIASPTARDPLRLAQGQHVGPEQATAY